MWMQRCRNEPDASSVAGQRPQSKVTVPSVFTKFSRFLVVGGLCTGIQYGLLIVLIESLHFNPTVASTIGYVLSSLVNYVLSYTFTFKSAAQHHRSLPSFVAIALCGVALNAAVTYAGTEIFGMHYLVAQVIATGTTLLWNFWANLRWTF